VIYTKTNAYIVLVGPLSDDIFTDEQSSNQSSFSDLSRELANNQTESDVESNEDE
jgi:hypothetical protein